MQAAAAGQARVHGRVQQVFGPGDHCLGVLLGEKLEKPLGADADPPAEKALKMGLAQPGAGCDAGQGRLVVDVGFDEFDGLFHPLVVSGHLFEVAHGSPPVQGRFRAKIGRNRLRGNPILAMDPVFLLHGIRLCYEKTTTPKGALAMNEDSHNESIDFSVDLDNLYREESFTDMKTGAIRRLVPIRADGSEDRSRTPVFVGSTQILTPEGPLPVQAALAANNLREAFDAFPYSMQAALNQMIEELEAMQQKDKEKNDSRIIVPGRDL